MTWLEDPPPRPGSVCHHNYLTALFVLFWQRNNQRRWRPAFWGRQLKEVVNFFEEKTASGDFLTSKWPGCLDVLTPPLMGRELGKRKGKEWKKTPPPSKFLVTVLCVNQCWRNSGVRGNRPHGHQASIVAVYTASAVAAACNGERCLANFTRCRGGRRRLAWDAGSPINPPPLRCAFRRPGKRCRLGDIFGILWHGGGLTLCCKCCGFVCVWPTVFRVCILMYVSLRDCICYLWSDKQIS